MLRSSEFRRGREAGWRELDDLISRIERHGVGALSPMELERLPLLYRATLSSLSVARGIALDRALLAYLENLCLRAFLTVTRPAEAGRRPRPILPLPPSLGRPCRPLAFINPPWRWRPASWSATC